MASDRLNMRLTEEERKEWLALAGSEPLSAWAKRMVKERVFQMKPSISEAVDATLREEGKDLLKDMAETTEANAAYLKAEMERLRGKRSLPPGKYVVPGRPEISVDVPSKPLFIPSKPPEDLDGYTAISAPDPPGEEEEPMEGPPDLEIPPSKAKLDHGRLQRILEGDASEGDQAERSSRPKDWRDMPRSKIGEVKDVLFSATSVPSPPRDERHNTIKEHFDSKKKTEYKHFPKWCSRCQRFGVPSCEPCLKLEGMQ